ncbi:hypothetical protein HBI56_108150 [Parastagonospora nodorum]|nr:hypothetical protein HBI95_232310 [Parastagonospora nodorum]KAH4605435.1 hypothetical protein HBH82_123910 [Parastagonospora nodorum]KAH4710136.1 hypothetical protein HBH67_044160 [Parastagonospora nodorum]KAH4734711.1 hypothetical protein HBH78_000340 [Parastagonospora nodorum]KAH4783767.1 hypothetical protein HBH62_097810 [Parastagonospora nodorum]
MGSLTKAQCQPRSLNYLTATASELQDLLKQGKISSEDLVLSYLDRIEKNNTTGAAIRALIEVAPKEVLLGQARVLDKQRQEGSLKGPLHGLPIVLKDNIDTKAHLRTGSGSLAIRDATVSQDAALVTNLENAGLIILAKANLSEWCNYRDCGTLPNAWSGAGGQGLLPYNFDYDPLGSSSGSAAALAAGFAPLAVGTETDGSLICPSSRGGCFALKPTVGLVARSGVIPISVTQDSPGPMAKSVRDIALLLNVIAGGDPRDEASIAPTMKREKDYTKFLQESFKDLKLGQIRDSFLEAVEQIRTAGATVKDAVEIETLQEMLHFDPGSVQNYEFKTGINAYLSTLQNTEIRNLADLIKYNEEHADVESPQGRDHAEQETFIECERLTQDDKTSHDTALVKQYDIARDRGIDAVLRQHDLDILIVPSEASKATRFAAMAGKFPSAH